MATAKEVQALSAPTIYLDGRRLKILPNSCRAELPGEVKSRAVSAGGGATSMVHGYDVEADVCKIKFDVANTGEMAELLQDYASRRRRIELSTIKIIEKTVNLSYDQAVMTNKIEIGFEADGKIEVEFMGRYASI